MNKLTPFRLTVKQPWATAISHGFKLVENRSWPPPPIIVGKRITIHAGARPKSTNDWLYTLDALAEVANENPPLQIQALGDFTDDLEDPVWRFGQLLCTVLVTGWTRDAMGIPPAQRRWFERGCYGWLLADPQILEVSSIVKGSLGLWK
jgi:hypothetical protein